MREVKEELSELISFQVALLHDLVVFWLVGVEALFGGLALVQGVLVFLFLVPPRAVL